MPAWKKEKKEMNKIAHVFLQVCFQVQKKERYVFKVSHHIYLPLHIHTYAHLDLIVWLVNLDPLFDFTVYALQVCICCLHTHKLHISLSCRVRERRHNITIALVRIHKYHTLRDLRGSYKGISEFYFENLQKLQNKS
jgi:hypothetical protein